jgi:hypothetical protein
LKARKYAGGVSLIAQDAKGLPKWIEMGRRKNMGILPLEVYAIVRGVEICIVKGRNKVSFGTDSKYITKIIRNAYSLQKLNKDTQEYVSFLRRKLQKGVTCICLPSIKQCGKLSF